MAKNGRVGTAFFSPQLGKIALLQPIRNQFRHVMKLYRNQSRYLFLIGGLVISGGIEWLVYNGAHFWQFLPWGMVALSLTVFFMPKRKVAIDSMSGVVLIRGGGWAESIAIKSITDVKVDEMEILLRTAKGTIMIFHSDFKCGSEESAFLNALYLAMSKTVAN